MEKIKHLLSSLVKLELNLQFNNKQVNPFASYLFLIVGALQVIKYLGKGYLYVLHPQIRKIFAMIIKHKNRILEKEA